MVLKFLQNFVKNKGLWIGSSAIIVKVCSFIIFTYGARRFSINEFGQLTITLSFLGFFLSIVGLGSSHGTTLWAAKIKNETLEQRKKIFAYAFTHGLLINFVLCCVMLVTAYLVYQDKMPVFYLILLFSLQVFGVFLAGQKKAEYMGELKNEKLAKADIFISIFGMATTIGADLLFGFKGYVIALVLYPFSILLFDRKVYYSPIGFFKKISPDFNIKEFWKFNITTALSVQVSDFIFLIDILSLSVFYSDKDIANYKTSSFIASNLRILAIVVMQSEYSKLCQHNEDTAYHNHFLRRYMVFFLFVSLFILVVGNQTAEFVMSIFGKEYQDYKVYHILLWGAIFSLLLRVPFGFLLSSIGKNKWNLFIAIFVAIFMSIGLHLVIPRYGLVGVAWLSNASLLLSGILAAIAYFHEQKKRN